MALNPRTPVIIGVGQSIKHPQSHESYEDRPEPLDLMVEALSAAGHDAHASAAVLRRLDELVAIKSFTWHPHDPARLVADRLSISPRTRLTPTGGNMPQYMVHESALRILSGEISAIGVVGSEAMYSAAMAKKAGARANWTMQGDDVPPLSVSDDERIPFTSEEYSNGLTLPVEVYPLFENARRARLGWSIETQRQRLGELWSHFASVAASNPYAWVSSGASPDAISLPSPANRMVSFPYTKLLVANLPVDMGAAYIMTSLELADSLGVARDRMVFPLAGADASDHWFISQRPALDQSPAMSHIWDALRSSGVGADDLDAIDLYSCFPTVVQTACDILGINAFDPQRIPTLTGGLTFGGGPGNNYVTHSIATMVERLRQGENLTGLVTGLGWFSTKHAWGTYSSTPPTKDFVHRNVQALVDAEPQQWLRQEDGAVTVETYTVVHGRDSAQRLVVAARHRDGARVWAKTEDLATMNAAELGEIIGLEAHIRQGVFHL